MERLPKLVIYVMSQPKILSTCGLLEDSYSKKNRQAFSAYLGYHTVQDNFSQIEGAASIFRATVLTSTWSLLLSFMGM